MTRRTLLAGSAALGAVAAQEILQLPPPKADARIAYGRDASQFGEVFLPKTKPARAVVIFIHGGFWKAEYDLSHAGHLCAALARAGAAVWSLEYRRVGQPGGGWPGTFDDIVHGAEFVRQVAGRYSLDLTRLVASGHSAGGHLALWLAAQRAVDLRGVVPLAGVCDLRRAWALRLGGGAVTKLLGGSPDEQGSRYRAADPVELLPISVAQRVLHGTEDTVVPFEISQRFARASSNAKLTPLQGAGHFELIDPRSAVWKTVEKNILEWPV
jgi:acetyl esterase/lipase